MNRLIALLAQESKFYTQEEEGQGLVEYALILVLVAIVALAALSLMGNNISNAMNFISYTVGNVI